MLLLRRKIVFLSVMTQAVGTGALPPLPRGEETGSRRLKPALGFGRANLLVSRTGEG